ncbi:MAG: hypothetical protein IKQ51_12050 [Bacteroidaceae bacterium]|nr:hypothetical protein [Bacteroidaceae bacterium]MBR6171411.1 hypothetical protein [Bacteroidaceae bacterium]
MKRINTILKSFSGVALLGLGFLLFSSCEGNQTLANVAVEDSLCIDTVATLDDVVLTDTVAVDSLAEDTL